MDCFFVTDLHGDPGKFARLFEQIELERPRLVFIGGDLLAGGSLQHYSPDNAISGIMAPGFQALKATLGSAYPDVFVILGNDDPKSDEPLLQEFGAQGLWHYCQDKRFDLGGISVYGYCRVPPTPFQLKDWERYDVSRFVDINCVAPEEGYHSVPFSLTEAQHRTIWEDLLELAAGADLSRAVFLFHSPPYRTGLDRAPLDGISVDHAPLDLHVGSVAIRRFIEQRQPLVTLHGHVHESFDLTGVWKENLGRTICLSAAGTGRALTLVRFDPDHPARAQRLTLD